MRHLFVIGVLVGVTGSAFGQPPQCPLPPQAPPVIGRHHCPCTSLADCTCTNCMCANCRAKPAPAVGNKFVATHPTLFNGAWYPAGSVIDLSPPPAPAVRYAPAQPPVYSQPVYRMPTPPFGGSRGGAVCVGPR